MSKSQALLIDADDTLWENNIYFERAIADFISFLITASALHPRSAKFSTTLNANVS